jgi:hypothetical protein
LHQDVAGVQILIAVHKLRVAAAVRISATVRVALASLTLIHSTLRRLF